MINLSSFIGFHARRSPARGALKYQGAEISYAAFNRRIRDRLPRNPSGKVLKRVLRTELET